MRYGTVCNSKQRTEKPVTQAHRALKHTFTIFNLLHISYSHKIRPRVDN